MIAPVLPMLAAQAKPFNSAEYFFEVKWDGVRALAAVEEGGWRLWGRGLADYRPRYPELAVLTALPSGTLVDGELVVFRDGLPRLGDVLQRHQLVDSLKIRQASRQRPVNYVLFDLLAVRGRCLLREPFLIRRGLLRDLLNEHKLAPLRLSDGVAECGERFFAQAVAQGHEGVIAKKAAWSAA